MTSLLLDIGNSRLKWGVLGDGAIERAFRVLLAEGSDAMIVLTGGDASRILTSLSEESLHRPHLVSQGLVQLLENRQ